MTDDTDSRPLAVPDGWSSWVESELGRALSEGLERDRVGMSHSTFKTHRQAIAAVLPVVEGTGIYTLDQLVETEALLELRSNLTEAMTEGSLAPSTWGTYTERFAKRCATAGMSEADLSRLRGTFKQARKDAGRPIEPEPEMTMQQLAEIVRVMDAWLESPLTPSGNGRHDVLLGISGYRGRAVTPLRRDRSLAFIALMMSGAPRADSVFSLRRCDVRGRTVQHLVKKGNIDPLLATFTIHHDLVRFVQPMLDRTEGENPLFDTNTYGDVRALLLSAGVEPHNGRVGMHRVRKAFNKACFDAGLSSEESAAALNHTPATSERAYATHSKRDKRAKGMRAWHSRLTQQLATEIEWRFQEDGLVVPWENLQTCDRPWKDNPVAGPDGLPPWPDRPTEPPPSLNGLWRFRFVEVKEPEMVEAGCHDPWQPYCATESSQGDVVIPYHSMGDNGPLWLKRGGHHHLALRDAVEHELDGGPAWIRTRVYCSQSNKHRPD